MLGIYATVLSLGFAAGPWLFSQIGSTGFLPFGVTFGLVMIAAIPVLLARSESPTIVAEGGKGGFFRYIWLVPTATAAVLVFGAVETGGFALFPVYGNAHRLFGSGGGTAADDDRPRQCSCCRSRSACSATASATAGYLLLVCAIVGLAGTLAMPLLAANWHLMAAMLFVWGGVVAALYTVGLAHLGSQLSGHDLASANAAFVFCYGARHDARTAGDRHRHGHLRPRRIRLVAGYFLRRIYRPRAGPGCREIEPGTLKGLTFRPRSLCVRPSFPRPGCFPS